MTVLLGTGAQVEDALRRGGVSVPVTGVALILMSAFMVICLLLVFSAIGGLIAVPVFEKRKGDVVPPPQPPQNLGGPGYGAGL